MKWTAAYSQVEFMRIIFAHTLSCCDWLKSLDGLSGAAIESSGRLSSEKGLMLFQDNRYWDILTEARCFALPVVARFLIYKHTEIQEEANCYFMVTLCFCLTLQKSVKNVTVTFGFVLFWVLGSTTRYVFLPSKAESRLAPFPSSIWYAPLKFSRVSSVMWTLL